ncbi:MAG TPA: TIGR03936 family radical SAM-associated protein [Candidatus Limnocylindrales bacterium]
MAFRRTADAPAIPHREIADTWLASLLAGDLPLARAQGTRSRPPLTFAAPLPLGMPAEHELADVFLTERLPAWHVRSALASTAPRGIELTAVDDVWVGAPALAAALVAAEYRVSSGAASRPDSGELTDAAASLLGSPSIPRQRAKGSGTVDYDLRPLLARIDVDGEGRTIRIRTIFHSERGAGRPEEAVAALGDVLGRGLVAESIVRERLILADELEAEPAADAVP